MHRSSTHSCPLRSRSRSRRARRRFKTSRSAGASQRTEFAMPHFARSDRLGVCLLVLLYAVSFARPRAQAPQTGSAPPERGPATGLILGQVVDAGSGRAVGGAIVSISGAANLPLPAMTDGDGRFLFPSLAAGNYTLSVAANGYVPGMFGRLRVDGPGRPLELGQNERVTDAQIRIWKYASIAGTVVDDAGEPL